MPFHVEQVRTAAAETTTSDLMFAPPSDQPQDDVASSFLRPRIAPSRSTQILQPDVALAPLVGLVLDGHAAERERGEYRVEGGGGDRDADHALWPYRAGSLGFFGGTSPVPPRRMLTPLPTSDGRPPEADRAKPLT